MTLYNRYVRWAVKGVWVRLFEALAQADGPPAQVLIDLSAVKAHRSAADGKGGQNQRVHGDGNGASRSNTRQTMDGLPLSTQRARQVGGGKAWQK